MNNWRIRVAAPASKQITALDPAVRKRVLACIAALPKGTIKKLRGATSLYRARVGNWRIIFRSDYGTRTIEVLRVAKRDEVYR